MRSATGGARASPTKSRKRPPARRRFAQHFLEPVWARKVVQAIAPSPGEAFLEIGPGTGALTRLLAASGARVVAVELDRDLAARLAAEALPSVTVLSGDFLTLDIVSALSGALGGQPPGPPSHAPVPGQGVVRVVGNLPYNVSTGIVLRLLDLQRGHGLFRDATLMVQKEVADRLGAAPGTRAYGALSVFVQLDADITPLLVVPPGAFRPAPRVRSAVVRLSFRPRRVPIADAAVFAGVVRTLFSRRRKTVLNALRPFAERCGVAVQAALRGARIDPRRRPETLQLSELARLAEFFPSGSEPPVL